MRSRSSRESEFVAHLLLNQRLSESPLELLVVSRSNGPFRWNPPDYLSAMLKPTPEDTLESVRRIRALELLKRLADLIEESPMAQGASVR